MRHLPRLLDARAPAVPPDHLRLEPVQLQQLQRLRVVARRDLHLVAARLHDLDQRPEHEHVRARRHVDPDLHTSSDSIRAERSVGGSCSTWRSYQSVNASRPQSWRLQSSAPATCSSSSRATGAGSKNPCERSVAGDSVARANGSSSPRSHAAAGIENPRLRPCTIPRGSSGAAAFRSSTFFESPRTLWCAGSANAKFVTTESRNGTRASRECAIEARSVFTSRSSTR